MLKPPSNLIACKPYHLLYLCERMRDDEIEQYMAFVPIEYFDPDECAIRFMTYPGPKFTVIGKDGFPACAGGYHEVLPGVWQSWMVGSCEGWKDGWRSITKGSRWLIQELFLMGARRVQTNALASRTKTHEWYERGLGLKLEGVWCKYGLQGQDVVNYARTA